MFPWSMFFIEAVRRGLKDSKSNRQTYSDTCFLLLWAGLAFAFFSLSGSKLGTEQEDTSGWMIDEPEVATRLRPKTTLDRNTGRLKALSPVPLHVIMRSSRDVPLRNAKEVLQTTCRRWPGGR